MCTYLDSSHDNEVYLFPEVWYDLLLRGWIAVQFPLASVEVSALTQGITFLYSQAGELLRRRRDRADAASQLDEANSAPPSTDRLTIEAPTALGGRLLQVAPDPAITNARAAELLRLCSALSNYVNGALPVDAADLELTQAVSELRDVLEDIFGQHLTFVGEDRPVTGEPAIRSRVRANTVRGVLNGVDVRRVARGSVDSGLDVGDVEAGAEVNGVRIDELG